MHVIIAFASTCVCFVLQEGDEVKFQVGRLPANRGERAVNMQSLKPPLRARVDSVKEEGQFGFLVFDVNSLKQQQQEKKDKEKEKEQKEKEKDAAASESNEGGDCTQEAPASSEAPVAPTTAAPGEVLSITDLYEGLATTLKKYWTEAVGNHGES